MQYPVKFQMYVFVKILKSLLHLQLAFLFILLPELYEFGFGVCFKIKLPDLKKKIKKKK